MKNKFHLVTACVAAIACSTALAATKKSPTPTPGAEPERCAVAQADLFAVNKNNSNGLSQTFGPPDSDDPAAAVSRSDFGGRPESEDLQRRKGKIARVQGYR